MRHHTTPCEYLLLLRALPANKRKTNTFTASAHPALLPADTSTILPNPQRIFESQKKTSVLPEAITTKKVSGEYGEQHHFQQKPNKNTKG